MTVKKKGKLSGLNKKNQDLEPPVAARGFSIPDSFSQLWLAGQGALARAQTEGPRLLEALIAEGSRVQKGEKTGAQAVLGGLEKARESLASGSNEVRKQASVDWDNLEHIFRDRVGKALLQLGVPSASDTAGMAEEIEALKKRISALEAESAKTPKAATRGKTKSSASTPA
ncbi:MAG: phasin family protein [Gammaproteobacteria bacterium]|nr:phasin family protein [Gammaproteobacteria bacterium]